MAYINAETTAKIRSKVKEQFPAKQGWKFSISKRDSMELRIVVLQAPIDLMKGTNRDYFNIHHFSPEQAPAHHDFWAKLGEIARSENWFDKSDSMTDYFHTAYYIHLGCGDWDKKFVYKANPNYQGIADYLNFADEMQESNFENKISECKTSRQLSSVKSQIEKTGFSNTVETRLLNQVDEKENRLYDEKIQREAKKEQRNRKATENFQKATIWSLVSDKIFSDPIPRMKKIIQFR